jgi:hypothetical protein
MATTSINQVQHAKHALELPLLLQYMANILQKKKRDPKASEQTPSSERRDVSKVARWNHGMFCLRNELSITFY